MQIILEILWIKISTKFFLRGDPKSRPQEVVEMFDNNWHSRARISKRSEQIFAKSYPNDAERLK